MAHVIVRHTVEDYNRWRPVFDEHAADRRGAGCRSVMLFRDANQPNQITVIMECEDLTRAKEFAQSASLREAMARGSVTGEPTVQFVDKVADLTE